MDRLKGSNAAARLANYRAKANDKQCTDERARGEVRPWHYWRYWKSSITSTPNNVRGDQGEIYSDSTDQYGTYLGDAHKLTRIRHNGWYADNFQDSLIIGGVAKMRTSRGTLYIPVTHCDGWGGTRHYIRDGEMAPRGSDEATHEQAVRDAAHTADGLAEREAEESRDYYAKDAAEQDILTARDRVHAINDEALSLIREIKANGKDYTPAVCKALRSELTGLLRQRRAEFKTIAAREADYRTAVQS